MLNSIGSNPLGLPANFYPKFSARMELENDAISGQGCMSFNSGTLVQILLGYSKFKIL